MHIERPQTIVQIIGKSADMPAVNATGEHERFYWTDQITANTIYRIYYILERSSPRKDSRRRDWGLKV